MSTHDQTNFKRVVIGRHGNPKLVSRAAAACQKHRIPTGLGGGGTRKWQKHGYFPTLAVGRKRGTLPITKGSGGKCRIPTEQRGR
jgi:hypothetical protein